MLSCLFMPGRAAADAAAPELLTAPSKVSRGQTTFILFDAGLSTRCSVAFSGPKKRKAGPFAQDFRGGILRMSFRIHRTATAGTWRGRIVCIEAGATRKTKFNLRVRGRGRARGPLLAAGSIRFTAGRAPGDQDSVPQTLTTQKNEAPGEGDQLGAGPYDNGRIADIGLSKLGKWAGQCKQAVNNWVHEASGRGQRLGGDYHANYAAQGGVQITRDQAQKGDIIQLHNPADQRGYYWPMHTAVVLSHQPGSNVFEVVDSNSRSDEIVRRHNYDPYKAAGTRLKVTIWRMGTVHGTPAVAPPTGGGGGGGGAGGTSAYEVAFQANTANLWSVGWDPKGDWALGLMEGTSPSITRLSGGGYQVAFQANTGNLWVVGSQGGGDTGYGMMRGTSPAIAGLANGGYEVAFQANTGNLWTVGSDPRGDWKLGMMGGTSPAITALPGGGYEVAFQANTGNLWTVGSDPRGDWKLGMMGGTSPAIIALPGGGYEVAFQANTGSLWTVGADQRGAWNLGMKGGTSPAITALPGGGYEVAFQANTGNLWTVGADQRGDWSLGMREGTSPSIVPR
jgi:hypothetical protein